MESRKMVTESFRQIGKFGMVCCDHWSSMCVILLTCSEHCVSVHTGSPINLFLYRWLTISPFHQMMFKLLCPFIIRHIIQADLSESQCLAVCDWSLAMFRVATLLVEVLIVSVCFWNRSIVIPPCFRRTLTSRNDMELFDHLAVNLIVRWKWLIWSKK